jgi:predicted AlkP superfamily pyrophosphatase or phosphodiesterase
MKRILFLTVTVVLFFNSIAQTKSSVTSIQSYPKPKLVVGIVIDQMRWDYLYRFYDLYKSNGGFKRLLGEGFSCDNTFVPYLPTVTACGHACVYTGSVPAIHGITGNNWWDNNLNKSVYCVEDKTVQGVGSSKADDGQMSPKNVWATTITDELKLATNFRSKVIGISMKDRGAVIPAGHSADAAYWYDGKSGNFISSTYYMKELPTWLQDFNNKKIADSYYEKNWNISLDKSVYEKYCDTDDNAYEGKTLGKTSFPYDLQQYKAKDYAKILTTPYGNNFLEELAKTVISNEQMGKHDVTDFLAVSFSSTDYVGHAFGPNSWELLDTYVRLDEVLGDLFNYLDKTVGKNQYTVFLTADHAGAQVPEFLNKHNISGGRWADADIKKELNDSLSNLFGGTKIINAVQEYNIYLNHGFIDSAKLNEENVKKAISNYLLKKEAVLQVVDTRKSAEAPVPAKIREMIVNGYNAIRSGDLQIIMKTGVMDAGKTGMSHGVWNTYDSHIPLIWYGWGIKHGSSSQEVYMTDISATVAAMLHIQMPSGCIGKVIEYIMK